jgi:hypothetical protein
VCNTTGNTVASVTPWPSGDDAYCAATDESADFSVTESVVSLADAER